MSSKIHRGGAARVQPVEWRRPAATALTGTVPQAYGRPASGGSPAGGEQEIEARAAAAYQLGLAEGEAAAGQRAQAYLEPVLAGLSGIVTELGGMRRKFRAEAEGATVALAMSIARRVLNRELHCDPDAILGLVKAAFERCDARETHCLRVSPADAAAIQENRDRLQLPPRLKIVADVALRPGSAIFETSRGDLDASLDTQLSEIERGLTDVLRKRSR